LAAWGRGLIGCRRRRRASWFASLAAVLAFLIVGLPAGASTTAVASLPAGFQESVLLTGLTEPTAMEIAPDGRVFVAQKGGLIKVFDSLSDPVPSIYADLRTNVHSFNDRGLLGMALDPNFVATPNIYVSYAHDAAIGGTAPRWGLPGADSDGCPTPPGPTLDGCVISGRLSRLVPPSQGSASYRDSVLADSPRAYWRLGETSGTSAADASGNNRAGSYVGSPALGQTGALVADANTAVGFNGSSQYTSVPYAATLNPAQVSVEAWAYVTGGQGTYRSVVTSRDYAPGNARGYILYAGTDDSWQFWLGGGADWNRVYGPPVTLNAWTHLVATYDGTTARLYVNGVLAGSSAAGYALNTQRPLRVATGSTEGSPRYFLPGRVDEVAVYGSALSGTRVQSHYDAGRGSSGLAVEQVLIEDWCQQYPTGSSGAIEFGADGALYMTAGAGGSYTFLDYGQDGDPLNPCGDPPGGVGATLTPPTAEGGWLRSQDLRTQGDPVGLGGTLIRVDRSTGQALPDNPLASHSDPNARRIVAYGFRNPFRIAIRPGTRDVWIGDVGGGIFEEVDRVPDGADAAVENFGWPCYEGAIRQPGYDPADLTICEALYQQPGAVTPPVFAYTHGQQVVPGESCSTTTGSAISGLAFAPAGGGAYPTSYGGALFIADYSRNCIWVMYAGGDGAPNPSTVTPFLQPASYPVDLRFGPDGKLYYVDIGTGSIRRIDYFASNQPPNAVASASTTSGTVPLTVTFDGSSSSDPDGTIASYAWDLDGDGQYDDSTAQQPSFQYTTAGTYMVRLRVTDNQGAPDDSDPITITAGSSPPTAFIDTPASSFTWRAGDVIAFSGHGTDPEDGTVPASRMTWNVTLQHCVTPGNCHSHPVQSFSQVASGSFSAPEHEYPSFLRLTLTVTDSSGLTDIETVDLQPKTVILNLGSVPTGLTLVVNSTSGTTPFAQTVVEASTNTLTAPSPQTMNGTTYVFSGWSDGGAQTHTITANTTATYTATYTAQTQTGYSGAVLADSPLAYWRLGEASGTSAADASGNNRTGSYVGSPSRGLPGALAGDANTAVGFNGSSQYVSVPYAAALNPSQFTVEAWAYPTGGQGTYRSVVTSRDYAPGNTRGYILYAAADNTWQLWLGNGGAGWEQVFGPTVTLNAWTHLVATYDGTTARLYLNGVLAASSGAAYSPNAQRPLRMAAGATDRAPDYFLPGRVDEVAVYGSALAGTRVQAHYAAGTSGGGGNQPPTAVASAAPTSGPAPLTVNFDGSGSSDPDGSIASYAWDLDGDGQYDDSTAQKPSFQYTTAAIYTVRLRVTDNGSAQDDSDPLTITATSSGGGGSYSGAVLADSPLAYWRLGEASGTSAADASGNNRTGSYVGSPSRGLPGALAGDANTAVGFNGSSQYVSVPYAAALNPSQFTVEAWAYPTGGQGTYRSVVTSRDYAPGNTRGYILYAAADNTWQLWLGNGGAGWEQVFGPTVTLNAWTHLVATYDGTTARLYLNGVLAASSGAAYSPNAQRPLRMAAGATDRAPDYFLPGRVDEVAVYGSALAGTRVQAHYVAGAGG
jgi:PKD repeat protein